MGKYSALFEEVRNLAPGGTTYIAVCGVREGEAVKAALTRERKLGRLVDFTTHVRDDLVVVEKTGLCAQVEDDMTQEEMDRLRDIYLKAKAEAEGS